MEESYKGTQEKRLNIKKCPQCQELVDFNQKPLYCLKCGKTFNDNFFTSIENNQIEKENLLKCPQCQREQSYFNHPRFCIQCGFQFQPKTDRKFLINDLIDKYNSPQEQSFYPSNSISLFNKTYEWGIGQGFIVPFLAVIIQSIIGFFFIFFGLNLDNLNYFEEFLFTSLSLIFLLIPLMWIKIYYPHEKLSFKRRLNELGFHFDKYNSIEKGREILFGILFAALAVIMAIGIQIIGSYLIEWIYNVNIEFFFDEEFYAVFGQELPPSFLDLFWIIMTSMLFVGLPEEILFRGFVQRSFEAKLNRPAATILTAFYFSMFHIILFIFNPPVFIFLFLTYFSLSLMLGLLRNWRKDLICPIVTHIFYNIIQTIMIFFIMI